VKLTGLFLKLANVLAGKQFSGPDKTTCYQSSAVPG
jgi:hypothetical protein